MDMAKTLTLIIAATIVLAAAAPAIVRLLNAATPLALVLLVAILAWKLVQYYTRQ